MRQQQGFSLVELAIVVLVMGLLLGGLAMPLSVQLENKKVTESRDLLSMAEQALQGFAQVYGHLPCPATPASNGLASVAGGACTVQHGFLPASTLGIDGLRNDDNLLLDSWSSPIRYSVSNNDFDADGNWDFTSPGEMSDVTIPNLAPDLNVCSTAAGSSPSACADAQSTLTGQAPLVIYSMGKDWANSSSTDQLENVGATLGGGPTGANYPVAADIVFVSRRKSEQPGSEFDDIVSWTSANTLYHELVRAGRLP